MGVTYFNRRQRVHISGKRHTYVDRPQSEWALIDGATRAIVDADLFRTAQARLDQPMVRPVPEYTRYLLWGFLRCSCSGPACGHELQRNSNYRYYSCINTVPRTNRPRTCDAKGVRVSILVPQAWAEVCNVIQRQSSPNFEAERAHRPHSTRGLFVYRQLSNARCAEAARTPAIHN